MIRVGPNYKIFDAITETTSVKVQIPYGHTVLLVHDLTSGTGHVALSNTGVDSTIIAHQGGTDAVNAKATTQSTSYSSLLMHCSHEVSITCTVATGTHTVSMYTFEK
jgi:hypothetical protein